MSSCCGHSKIRSVLGGPHSEKGFDNAEQNQFVLSGPKQTLGADPVSNSGGLSASEKCTKCIEDVLAVLTLVSKHGY